MSKPALAAAVLLSFSIAIPAEIVTGDCPCINIYSPLQQSFCDVTLGTNVLSNDYDGLPRFLVQNWGTTPITLTVSATISGGMTLGSQLGDVGPDRCVLAGIFTGPETLELGKFGDNDVIGATPEAATTDRYADDAGTDPNVLGFNVGPGEGRALRFLLQAPTEYTKGSTPQTIHLTFSSLEAPTDSVTCELAVQISDFGACPCLELAFGPQQYFGMVALGTNVISTTEPQFIFRNIGTTPLTLTVSATTSDGMTLGGQLGDVGDGRFVIAGIFTEGSNTLELEDFSDNDVIGPAPATASDTVFANPGEHGYVKGFDVPPLGERSIRFLLQTPTLDCFSWGAPQTIHLTFSSVEHPSYSVSCELIFSVPSACIPFEVSFSTLPFGAIELNTYALSNQDSGMPRHIVRNISTRTLNYVVSASISGGMTLGNQLGDVGTNRCVIAGIFTDPVRTLDAGEFSDEDVIGATPAIASTMVLAKDSEADLYKGFDVPPAGERNLRFLLQAPTLDTTGGAEQTIFLTFQCLENPAASMDTTLTFRVNPGSPTSTPTVTPTLTLSPTPTNTPTLTPTATITETATISPTATWTPTATPTSTDPPTCTDTPTASYTPSWSPTSTLTGTWTTAPTPAETGTCTPGPTASVTATLVWVPTASPTPVLLTAAGALTVSAYPNPARGQVNFVHSVPDADRISIDIYRLDGERVASIVERPTAGPGGTFTTAWQAAGVAPGVYLCRIKITNAAGKVVLNQTKKVALIR